MPVGALAHLGIARAYALQATQAQGDQGERTRAKARTEYEEFLTLWKHADPDLPILNQAKTEYQKLHQLR